MEEEKAFTNYQEIHLDNKYVRKDIFYDYQKKQDERMDKHDIEFAKVIQTFKLISKITLSICIPLAFLLFNYFLASLK